MKIIFAGTPEFAVPCLTALLDSPYEVCAVYTQPDRPAGRGRRLTASPVKQLASGAGVMVYQPQTLKDPAVQREIERIEADLMVVVAYGLILPKPVLQAPRFGCINVHASLLPRWRGAAPIQHAILAGDVETGVTIMQMEEGLDSGPILTQRACPISDADTAETLHQRLAALGAELLLETLPDLVHGRLRSEPQNASQVTYAPKIDKQDAWIDWTRPAADLVRRIRAFNPWPVCFTEVEGGAHLRIWDAVVAEDSASSLPPGTVIRLSKQGLDVAAGAGVLRVVELQMAGGRRLRASEFCNTKSFRAGSILGHRR